jgi:predicted nucleotidyltransferase
MSSNLLHPNIPKDLVGSALGWLANAVPGGTRIIVFGSHARHQARPDSDLDLLVIEPEVPDRMAEMVRLSDFLGRHLIPADVVVMSRSVFELQHTIPNTLAFRAAQEGDVHEIPN